MAPRSAGKVEITGAAAERRRRGVRRRWLGVGLAGANLQTRQDTTQICQQVLKMPETPVRVRFQRSACSQGTYPQTLVLPPPGLDQQDHTRHRPPEVPACHCGIAFVEFRPYRTSGLKEYDHEQIPSSVSRGKRVS